MVDEQVGRTLTMIVVISLCLIVLPLSLIAVRIVRVYRNANRIRRFLKQQRIPGPTWQDSQKFIKDSFRDKPADKLGNGLSCIKPFYHTFIPIIFIQNFLKYYLDTARNMANRVCFKCGLHRTNHFW